MKYCTCNTVQGEIYNMSRPDYSKTVESYAMYLAITQTNDTFLLFLGGGSRLWLHKKQLQNKLKWSHAVKLYLLTLASISYWWYQTNSGVLNWARVRVCFISQEFSFSSVRRWMWYFFFQKLHGLAFGWEDKNSLLQLQSCWDTDLSLISHERDKESCTSKAEEQLKRPWHWKERCKIIIWWKMSFKLFHSSSYLCVCLKIQHWWFHTVVYVILKGELHKHQYM